MGWEGGGPGGGGVWPTVERRREAKLEEEEEETATSEVPEPLSAAVVQSRPRWTTDTGRLS